jgi:Zn-dependent peptidase ImmA (M78 family)
MVFYLREPPKNFSVVKDFRILPDSVPRVFSTELRLAIRRAQERQAWASAYFEDEGYPQSALVGTYSYTDDPTAIGRDLRNTLAANITDQSSCDSKSAAFVYWRRLVERAGVFVFQVARVKIEEMRGFSLPNAYAPAVAINSKESFLPKIFTLIHELAHILIGKSSISGAGPIAFAPRPRSRVERFCNQVAAEVIIPKNDFINRVPSNWMERESEVLRQLSRIYWVSQSVIALRLFETGMASQDYVNQKLNRPRRKEEKTVRVKVPQARIAIGRVGESFTRTALSAYRAGSIHGGELSVLLNMKLKHLPQLEQIVLPGQVQPAITKNAS